MHLPKTRIHILCQFQHITYCHTLLGLSHLWNLNRFGVPLLPIRLSFRYKKALIPSKTPVLKLYKIGTSLSAQCILVSTYLLSKKYVRALCCYCTSTRPRWANLIFASTKMHVNGKLSDYLFKKQCFRCTQRCTPTYLPTYLHIIVKYGHNFLNIQIVYGPGLFFNCGNLSLHDW